MSKKKELQKLKIIVKKIARECSPEKIILFGSYAWGKPTYDSDFDLMVIKKKKKGFLQDQREIRRLINGALPVDILVYTPKEIKKRLDLGDFFIEDIIKKGKTLYAKN